MNTVENAVYDVAENAVYDVAENAVYVAENAVHTYIHMVYLDTVKNHQCYIS